VSGVHNATNWLDNPFWRYSIKQYSQPECASFLLNAQDHKQLDVNILLFIGYISDRNLRLPNKGCLNKAIIINFFLIRPIRWLRRMTKHLTPIGLYRWIKHVELKSEQLEQGVLYRLAEQLKDTEKSLCFERNLEIYMGKEEIEAIWLQALKEYLQPDKDTN